MLACSIESCPTAVCSIPRGSTLQCLELQLTPQYIRRPTTIASQHMFHLADCVCPADGISSIEPPQLTDVTDHPGHTRCGRATDPTTCDIASDDISMSEPSIYEELASTSGESDATYNSPLVTPGKVASGNVPDSCDVLLQYKDAPMSELHTTIGNVLRRHSGQIERIDLDASAIANPESSSTMAHAISLPFLMSAVASAPCALAPAPALPDLTALTAMNIKVSRAISARSVLEFLHCCPMLRTLAVHNSRRHPSVFPESIEDIAAPHLPFLEELTVDGLLTGMVESFLDKLLPSLKDTTKVELRFFGAGYPVLQHGPALQKIFAPMRHACLSYMQLSRSSSSEDAPMSASVSETNDQNQVMDADHQYVLSFSDIAARVRLYWHWTNEPGVPPNLGHIGLVSPSFANVHTISLFLRNVQPSYYDLFSILCSFRGLKRLELASTQPAPSPQATLASLSESKGGTGSERPPSPTQPCSFTSQFKTFKILRGAASALRAMANVPLLFAVEIAQQALSTSSDPSPGGGGCGTLVAPTAAPARPQAHIPAHTLRLARYYYNPIWALMVRQT
ncbi:hypothetical protein C8Q74DRAFT_563163 [Fomes fomentarius]|nr:hypothetical protein C8Q74DRAFT_563163 [Fomes fomentarius]